MDECPLVVLAVGNESRGDDALGPMLAGALQPCLPDGATLVVDFQLQVEHALELKDAALALFIDAQCGLDVPFLFRELASSGGDAPFSHALAPQAVLAVFRRLEGAPPPAFLLGIRAEAFGLGAPLSEAARTAFEDAWGFVQLLLREPDAAAWRRIAVKADVGAP